MGKYERGDKVMATKDLGGLFSSHSVRKGAEGVVVEPGGRGMPMVVNFDGDEVRCDESNVARTSSRRRFF